MNFYFEIYLKDPQTGHGGYDIVTGYVKNADDSKHALSKIKKKYPTFDEVIQMFESNIPSGTIGDYLIIDAREGRYPLAFTQRGKHGTTVLVANNFEEEQKCWLAMFLVNDVWTRNYSHLESDHLVLAQGARGGCWKAARALLELRDSYEYEGLDTESLPSVDSLLEKLNKDRFTKP